MADARSFDARVRTVWRTRLAVGVVALFASCARVRGSDVGGAGSGGHVAPGGTGSGGRGLVVSDAGGRDDAHTSFADGPGLVNDASPETGAAACSPDGGAGRAPGPYARRCATPTNDECDGASNVNAAAPNGRFGNDYDDDCDGKVDEGCACDAAHTAGTTKQCSLASASQIDPSSGRPAGWCAKSSIGTMKCVATDNEFSPNVWDGECRGAQPPFADDVCAPGDFDCDGVDANSRGRDCSCQVDVRCPSEPIVTAPFPDPSNLPAIDGASWAGGAAAAAMATNWRWTVTGGDCDNILPHPTFAIYGQPTARRGGPRLSSNTPQTGLGMNGNQHGFVVGPSAAVGSTIYPAFSLSGDYLVTGEWDMPDGHHACTVKVQVRSPGIRVELCWDNPPQDLDLHLARLQNPKACTHGWFATCSDGEDRDDCYFDQETGCRGFDTNPSSWGYARSPATVCHGWGATRDTPCDNPRLDQDNISCDPAVADPLDMEGMFGEGFCTPENINIDNPNDGNRFAVGVHFYQTNDLMRLPPPHPHVNIYCNGERRLAFGFEPTATPPTALPVLREPGVEQGGDMWEVATIQAKVAAGALTDCVVSPIHSKVPKANKDGSTALCVDTNPQNRPAPGFEDDWKFTPSGAYPTTPDGFCWH